jgi:hypothetical protein
MLTANFEAQISTTVVSLLDFNVDAVDAVFWAAGRN